MKKIILTGVASLMLLTGASEINQADAQAQYLATTDSRVNFMQKHMDYLKSQSQKRYTYANHQYKIHDPYEFVGTIESKYQLPSTAFAINKNTVITTKHSLFKGQQKDGAAKITDPTAAKVKFTPIRNRKSGNMTFDVKKIYFNPKDDIYNDIAVVKLKQDLPLKNYAKLGNDQTVKNSVTGETLHVLGYPYFSASTVGTPYMATGGHLVSTSPSNMPPYIIYTGISQPGNSGSPIFNSKNEVIGLHRASYDKGSIGDKMHLRMGVGISRDVLKFINSHR